MKSYRYTGIIIKRKNWGEADRLIVIFTKELGKIRVVAKGVRKITSRRAPHLEIFSYVKIFTHEGKRYPYITEVEQINGFVNIRQNMRRIAITYHLCEIIERLLPEKEQNEDLFISVLTALNVLNRKESFNKNRKIIRLFVGNLLVKLGYISSADKLTYSQLLREIENIIERPLFSLKLLTRIAKDSK